MLPRGAVADFRRDISQEHRALMEAVLSRNVDASVRIMNDHLSRTENAVPQLVMAPEVQRRGR